MPIPLRLTIVLFVLLLAGCGGSSSTTSQPSPTEPVLATLDVVRTGGFAAGRRELHLTPGDPTLAVVQDALGVPLPPSSVAAGPPAPDAYVYAVTAVLSDGTTASWSFDESQIPDDMQKLHTWLGTRF
jgi:hypothetical protein